MSEEPEAAIVSPSLVAAYATIRRIPWKNIQSSRFFILQSHSSKNKSVPTYRIVTKSFPQYKVAAHNDPGVITETWHFLHGHLLNSIEGKPTPKRIVKYIKMMMMDPQSKGKTDSPGSGDEDGFYTDDSDRSDNGHTTTRYDETFADQGDMDILQMASEAIMNAVGRQEAEGEDGIFVEPTARAPLRPVSPTTMNGIDEDISNTTASEDEEDADDEEFKDELMGDSEGAEAKRLVDGEPNFLDSLGLGIVNTWLMQIETTGETPNRNLFALIQRFVSWLQLPEIDPKKNSMAVIRERNLVRQRRLVLIFATLYSFLLRYVSFDFFLFLLISSNCLLLYLIKNSRKINVQMAKRTVRQRVGWAKQYLGGILKTKKGQGGAGMESAVALETLEGDEKPVAGPQPSRTTEYDRVRGTSEPTTFTITVNERYTHRYLPIPLNPNHRNRSSPITRIHTHIINNI
ncbi:hypothetical protein HK104_006447 [Borealophlyctis nickersoniae]|nr:hypothetical protein HK104_006447 [Borealophlyctis nickersoniae]